MVRQLAGYHSFHSIAKRIQLMESGGCGRMQGFQSYITNLVACLTEIDPLERAAGETPKCGTIFVPNNSGHHAGKRALRQQGEVGLKVDQLVQRKSPRPRLSAQVGPQARVGGTFFRY